MGSQSRRLQWGCIFLLLFFTVSCSMQALKKPEGEKDFFQETSRLEKLAREGPMASVRAQSHLELAFLYMNYRNPQLNYSRALQEMESYLFLSPASAQTDDFQNWLAVLKEVGRLQTSLEKVQKEVGRLQTSLEKVQKVNKSLRDEVDVLKKTIERLKSLDRQIEERRRRTK